MGDEGETRTGQPHDEEAMDVEKLLRLVENRCAFGPVFFSTHLAGFIRDRCPDPAEARPLVEVHLVGGQILDVCHVIGLAPAWLALAVYDDPATTPAARMRTELVPYAAIVRITISTALRESRIGFDLAHAPIVVKDGRVESAEDLLALVARPVGPAPE